MRTLLTLALLASTALVPLAAADMVLAEGCVRSDLMFSRPCARSTYVEDADAYCAGLVDGELHHFVVCAGEIDCPVYVDPVALTGGRGYCPPGGL